MRHICYVSGTRADFGLMERSLRAIDAHPDLDLSIIMTGMHLSPKYDSTGDEIVASGFRILDRIPVPLDQTQDSEMARNVGLMLTGIADSLARSRPDIVLLLGDRGEMLAGATAALHLNIPSAHIHGGERSGTIDESLRHAVSKLSHIHMTTTASARDRLIRMGEREDMVHVVGAPGVEGIRELATISREALCQEVGLSPTKPVVLFLFHPVVQAINETGAAAGWMLDTLLAQDLQIMAIKPNSDAGGDLIAAEIDARSGHANMRVATHVNRAKFVSWLAAADLLVGNTSAGIIESASFGTPTINVGSRQNLRERNANVIDVGLDPQAFLTAVQRALGAGRYATYNVYEGNNTSGAIAGLLSSAPIGPELLNKVNSF